MSKWRANRIAELEREFEDAYRVDIFRRIAELENENASLRAAQQWQPIETAPKDGSWIMACGRGLRISEYPAVIYWDDQWISVQSASFTATHWMPIPKSPQS